MPSPASFTPRERQARSRLHFLLNNAEAFIHGSLIEMARTCGNPRCHCASDDDQRHRSLYLGQSRGGKKSMVYLPEDLVGEVRKAVENFEQALTLLEQLNDEGRLRLDKRKAARKKARKRSSPRSKKPRESS